MITYHKGDATRPQGTGNIFIVHVCNNVNAWGAGFVMALSKRWKEPERAYHAWAEHGDLEPFELGNVQCVLVSSHTEPMSEVGCFVDTDKQSAIYVCNCIAQKGIGKQSDGIPFRHNAFEICLTKVASTVSKKGGKIVMPRVGCGLGGATWDTVEPIIERVCDGLTVEVYDL
jgi:O-acetyl-ADP-ribose deacetylase (regulator of RNase III)